jgi:polyhydroxybutyrate depolymerase
MITTDHRPRRNRRRLAGTLLAVSLITAACGGGDDAASESVGSTTAPTAPPTTALPTTTEAPTTTAPPTTDDTEASIDCASVPTGMTDFVLDAGGAEHDVRVYVPTTYDGSSELPLVMNFHGFGSTGDQQAAFTGYEDLAEEEGFVVVHPTAVPSSADEQGRNSWETPATDDPAKDDVEFTNELLDLLIEDYCVDETRVYATGMSGGGLFTSQLVCEMSDRLAAAVSVAAIYFPASCDPAEAVPFMAIHGTEDPTVPFDGDLTGTRFESEPFAQLLFSTPIPHQFAQFAAVMGCDPEGERIQTSTDVFTTTYSGCDDDVPLVFHEVVGGGHAWPSSPLTEPDSPVVEQLTELQGYSTFDIDATADAWAFFEQHTR